jgi:transglutaminase-like putative cysteine protease
MRKFFSKTKMFKIDGILYSIGSWLAFLVAMRLNEFIFPPDTFPRELAPSAWLLWMTILGSFFTWRDGTLLFQSIPALAMFGFVGCYDTFKGVVFLFFIFLICFALIFSRAHARDMQSRAIQSGYFSQIQQIHLSGLEQVEVLRKGPWRWAAGAEWALGSALVIVVLSILGAPVIQETAKPISGAIVIRAPRLRPQNTSSPNQTSGSGEQANVGNGPVRLRAIPRFEISGNLESYYRTMTYSTWGKRSWSNAVSSKTRPNGDVIVSTKIDRKSGETIGTFEYDDIQKLRYPGRPVEQFLDEYRSNRILIKPLAISNEVPQLGNAALLVGTSISADLISGMMLLASNQRNNMEVAFNPVRNLRKEDTSPLWVNTEFLPYLQDEFVPQRTRTMAEKLLKAGGSDAEIAERLRKEISKSIVYNTNVDRTPDGEDAAEYALFDSKEGYCDVFATNMVLMARVARIPSRYVVGYLADANNVSKGGVQTLLENDSHAWAELYFENVGWVVFDATVGADEKEGGGRKDAANSSIFTLQFLARLLNGLIVIFSLIAVYLIYRLRKMPKSAVALRTDFDRSYLRFIAAIKRHTNKRKLLHESTREYLNRVFPDDIEAKQLGTDFEDVYFGGDTIDQDKIKGFLDRVIVFEKRLKSLK